MGKKLKEEQLRNIIYTSFWDFDKDNQKGMLRDLQRKIMFSPKELANTDVVLDENGNIVSIKIPKKYNLVIRSNGEDCFYEIDNYTVDKKANKAYQVQTVKYKAPDGYYVISPKGIVECKKTLTRTFELTSPFDVIMVTRNKDELNSLSKEYLKVANRTELHEQEESLLNAMEYRSQVIDKYRQKRKITIKQSIILKDGKILLVNNIYDPSNIIESLEGYSYNDSEKCFSKVQELTLYYALDFNLVLQDINHSLGTDLKDADNFPTSPFIFLCSDEDKLNKLLKLYEVSQGIAFYNNRREVGISENCFVVDRPKSYKPKKKRKQQ